MIKATETPVKFENGYGNPIKKWYEDNTNKTYSRAEPYECGMFITINNHQCYYKHLSSQFRELYISILSALGIKLKRSDVKEMIGKWLGNRVTLPPERKLLELLNYKVPILLCGVHNYKPDDYRSKGNEYLHSHYFLYNIHPHLQMLGSKSTWTSQPVAHHQCLDRGLLWPSLRVRQRREFSFLL